MRSVKSAAVVPSARQPGLDRNSRPERWDESQPHNREATNKSAEERNGRVRLQSLLASGAFECDAASQCPTADNPPTRTPAAWKSRHVDGSTGGALRQALGSGSTDGSFRRKDAC